ncbi:hypothetical protein SUH3_20410 [Pseudosulfitobacter pseudonitzschiae]|uniref:DUF4435 domain-containing protein n=2 Tax=Pseudosulfitobacter pseudonitzschiae TaxID=1402135 RepID=A0A073J1J1_9RHOB|nr:hypothetical protein SUH3_20410 [Pseudosulfitobacter pseudonitzschiae]
MSDVVSSLSSGFMTLEDGLLVLGERYGPITIVSEGNNSIILSKWCELFFPKLKVLKGAESKSGFRQLCTLSHFLDGQNTRHKWLIVVDCDKFGELEKIKSGHAVESFAFDFHENRICKTGIENMFNEDLLKDYARLRTGEKGEALIFESPQKREFANFIKEKGKEEHFVNFLKLKEKVESMLTSVSSENPD